MDDELEYRGDLMDKVLELALERGNRAVISDENDLDFLKELSPTDRYHLFHFIMEYDRDVGEVSESQNGDRIFVRKNNNTRIFLERGGLTKIKQEEKEKSLQKLKEKELSDRLEIESMQTTIAANNTKINLSTATIRTQYIVAIASVLSVFIIGYQAYQNDVNSNIYRELQLQSLEGLEKAQTETSDLSRDLILLRQKTDFLRQELQRLTKTVNSTSIDSVKVKKK